MYTPIAQTTPQTTAPGFCYGAAMLSVFLWCPSSPRGAGEKGAQRSLLGAIVRT